MKFKTLAICSLVLLCQQPKVWAGDGIQQKVIIDGTETGLNVKSITFDGNNALVTFEDGTAQTTHLSKLSIEMLRNITAISTPSLLQNGSNDYFHTLDGRNTGSRQKPALKGIYLLRNKKVVVK